MTGLPRSPLRASVWSGVACKVKSGAGVPAGKIFDRESPFLGYVSELLFITATWSAKSVWTSIPEVNDL